MKAYMVAGTKSWNRRVFEQTIAQYPGRWFFVDSPNGLQSDWIKSVVPRYIFFLHWSWRVPAELTREQECVVFHMTDVPYGRGGSPLQNLIIRGHRTTMLTALRMVGGLDAGPVYLKEPLSLDGLAEEIYTRASELAAGMILRIVREEITPIPQAGEPTVFQRRHPDQSSIPACDDLRRLFDFLRMLDAEGYPRAFLVHKGFRYEFSRPALYEGRIVADVRITAEPENRSA